MDIIREWLKQVVFCMCFLELLYQLVPRPVWQKYLKFTGGLIFTLVLMQPVLQMLSMDERMDQIIWKWQIQEESRNLREAQTELAEFQNQQIQTGVKEELERQVRILVQDYGGAVEEVDVQIEENGEIISVQIRLQKEMQQIEECRTQLAVCLGLDRKRITIQIGKEGRQDEAIQIGTDSKRTVDTFVVSGHTDYDGGISFREGMGKYGRKYNRE